MLVDLIAFRPPPLASMVEEHLHIVCMVCVPLVYLERTHALPHLTSSFYVTVSVLGMAPSSELLS